MVKVSLLLLTGYLYLEANKANEEVKATYLGLNTGQAAKFQKTYQEYQIAASLTLGFFAYSGIRSYLRFGRNENFMPLHIPSREIRTLSESSTDLYIKDRINRIDFLVEKIF